LTVLVECNTGADRCGVGTPSEAARLARRIAEAPGLRFGGLMTYPPADGAARVQTFMSDAKRLIEAEGLEVPCITSGGTPGMMQAARSADSERAQAGHVYL
jgi:D-serine deaminase-like pyridoxal phosphate-dependent protein